MKKTITYDDEKYVLAPKEPTEAMLHADFEELTDLDNYVVGKIYKAMIAASQILEPASCDHNWVDMRNSIVKSGELCTKCGAIRAGNHSIASKEQE